MVRLPDYRDVGGGDSVQSRRRGLSQGDFDSGAVGRGVAKLGGTAANIGFDMREEEQAKAKEALAKQKALSADNDALDLLRADVERKKRMLEHQRSFENDPNPDTYDARFEESAKAIREETASIIRNPQLREKFKLQAEGSDAGIKDGILRRGMALKDQAREVEVESILEQNRARFIDPKATPEQRAQARMDIDAHITLSEQSGLLKPEAAARLKKKYSQQLAIDDAETRLLAEPEKLLEDLEALGSGGIQKGMSAADLIKQFEGDEDAGWDYGHYSGPYGVRRERGEKLTPEQAEPRMHARIAEIEAEMAAKIKGPLTDAQRAALTSLFYNIGTGRGRLDEAAKLINSGRSDTIPSWIRQFDRNSDGKYMRGLANRRREEAKIFREGADDGETSREEELIKRYGALDPKQRLTVIKHAQTSMAVGIEDAVKKDIARIKAGLEPEPDQNGETAIQKAERLIGKTAKAQELRIRYDNARAERAALAPLDTMTEDQADQHIASFRDQPWLQTKVAEAWKKRLKLRDEDPASLVTLDETVRITSDLASKRASSVGLSMDDSGNLMMEEMPGTADPEQKHAAVGSILEARLQAQRSRGIEDYQTKIITKREAKALMQLPTKTNMDDKEYRAVLEAAAQRALDWYGPEYGQRALKEAIQFQKGSTTSTKAQFEARILKSIAMGEEITASDIRKYSEVTRTTDMMSREFEMADPTAVDATRPYIGQPLQPTEQHVEWLKTNIADPAAIAAFDAKFGEGAAARALYAGKDAKTTKDLGIEKPAAPAKSLMQSLFGN